MIIKLTIVPVNGMPYKLPPPDQEKIRLSVSTKDGTVESLEVILQAVETKWAHSGVRIEGYTYYRGQRCRIIGYYNVDQNDDDLGRLHIHYRP